MPKRNACCAAPVAQKRCSCRRVIAWKSTAYPERRVSTEEIARCLSRKIDKYVLTTRQRRSIGYEDMKCMQHLFRVASGIDSMVVGETEVFGQVKKAYESARATGAAGPILHRLFQRAFRVAKQVRTHTEITRGSVSVGSVGCRSCAKNLRKLWRNGRVLVLGAGETSERTARALVSRGVVDLRVSNRSSERALELAPAGRWSRPFPSIQWREQCREIDILITSTSSDEPLLAPENLAPMLRDRPDRPLFIIDIAVPRDVDPSVNEMEGVYLYDIDSLQSVAEQSLALRRQQITAAEAIITEHIAAFRERFERGLTRHFTDPTHSTMSESSLRMSEL